MLSVSPFPLSPGGTAAPEPISAMPGGSACSSNMSLEPGEGRRLAQLVAVMLIRDFALPERARDYATALRAHAAAGRYDMGSRGELASLMTADLMAVHDDGELEVSVVESSQRESTASIGDFGALSPVGNYFTLERRRAR